jgi:beta-RFAP synthase
MPPSAVHVIAASRLHFGLIALGDSAKRQFGGVGVMIEPPQSRLRLDPAARFSVEGPGAERVRAFAQLWQRFRHLAHLPLCRITVETVANTHVGLGAGTQLGLAVASGLNTFCQLPTPTTEALASSVQRGLRSAVGTHGFLRGGLIFEYGKSASDSLGPLGRCIPIPDKWRFVLVSPRQHQGLWGDVEQRAFAQLPAVPAHVSETLLREVSDHMLPAAEKADFIAFSDSVFRFGYQSGLSFAQIQGSAYNGPRLTALVHRIRDLGVRGVGQSSWGPTIFALCPDQQDAQQLVAKLNSDPSAAESEIWIAHPRNTGAGITIES